MGYYSTIHRLNVEIALPFPEVTLSDEQKVAIAHAEALGLEVTTTNFEKKHTEYVNSLLESFDLAYWFTFESDDLKRGELVGIGESGKAYSLESSLSQFVKKLSLEGYSVTGEFYLEGEDPGDVSRYTIADSEVTVDKAKLVFPDGEVYE